MRGHDQSPLFRYANTLPVQKTAFTKYLKAVVMHTDLVGKYISPHCFRIGANFAFLIKLKPWGVGTVPPTGSISG